MMAGYAHKSASGMAIIEAIMNMPLTAKERRMAGYGHGNGSGKTHTKGAGPTKKRRFKDAS